MSFLTTSARTLASRAIRPATSIPVSAFHTTPSGLALNESDQNRENLDNTYEAEKQDGLKKNKEGRGEWKQELASNSEASVKADREDISSGSKDFKEMQERTKHLPTDKEKGKTQ